MAKPKQILDIRFYAAAEELGDGRPMPGRLCDVYPMAEDLAALKAIDSMGPRLARKAREFGLITGDYDHVYINLTPAIPAGEVRFSPCHQSGRMRYVDYGLTHDMLDGQTPDHRLHPIGSAALSVLRLVAVGPADKDMLISRLTLLNEQLGTMLPIHHKVKETAKYRLSASYQIRPGGEKSTCYLSYWDKIEDLEYTQPITDLFQYEDALNLLGSIVVKSGQIHVQPRKSFQASLTTNRYDCPYVFDIDSIKSTQQGAPADLLTHATQR